MEKIA